MELFYHMRSIGVSARNAGQCPRCINVISAYCRDCVSVCVQGVAWGCRWVYEDNGVWKETCYCEDRDGCNMSSLSNVPLKLASLLLIVAAVVFLHRTV